MSTTIEFPCPNCKRTIRTQARYAGRTGQCPNCSRKVTIPGTPNEVATLQLDQAGAKSSSTDVSAVLSILIGAAATALLFILIFFPLKNHYLGALFVSRGPIQFFSTFVTCSGLAMLALKYRAVKQQLSYAELELELIPLDMGMQITPGNVQKFVRHLEGLPAKVQKSILGRRIHGALEHFRARSHVPEVQAYLASSAQLDASSIESSYTLLRAFIWTVPILGFIGTVMGISGAVGNLADQFALETAQVAPAESTDKGVAFGGPKDKSLTAAENHADQSDQPDIGARLVKGMTGVTHGLAVAFDTTFVALIMAIILLFPTEALRKTEYAMLDRIEGFTNESLLRRISDEGVDMPLTPDVAKVLEPAFQEHQRWLVKWQTQVGELGELIGQEFDRHMMRIEERLGNVLVGLSNATEVAAQSLSEGTRQATQSLSEAVRSMAESTENWSQASRQVAQTQDSTMEAAEKMQELLRENSHSVLELARQYPEKLDDLSRALDRFREMLSENTDRLETLLADGKASATPMLAAAPRRRSIFGFWKRT